MYSTSCGFLLSIPSIGTLGLELDSECSDTVSVLFRYLRNQPFWCLQRSGLGSEPPAASLGIQESLLAGDKALIGRGGGTEVWLQGKKKRTRANSGMSENCSVDIGNAVG